MRSFRILGQEFRCVPVLLERADKEPDDSEDVLGTVGAPLLRNFRLTFDYRGKRLCPQGRRGGGQGTDPCWG